jgi:hypothetical protein
MFCPNCARVCDDHNVPEWNLVHVCHACEIVYEKTGVGIFAFSFAEILWAHMPSDVQPKPYDPFTEENT